MHKTQGLDFLQIYRFFSCKLIFLNFMPKMKRTKVFPRPLFAPGVADPGGFYLDPRRPTFVFGSFTFTVLTLSYLTLLLLFNYFLLLLSIFQANMDYELRLHFIWVSMK